MIKQQDTFRHVTTITKPQFSSTSLTQARDAWCINTEAVDYIPEIESRICFTLCENSILAPHSFYLYVDISYLMSGKSGNKAGISIDTHIRIRIHTVYVYVYVYL